MNPSFLQEIKTNGLLTSERRQQLNAGMKGQAREKKRQGENNEEGISMGRLEEQGVSEGWVGTNCNEFSNALSREEIKIQSCFFMSSIANYHMRKYWKKIHKYAYTKNIQTTSIHRIINTVNRFHKARTLTLLKSYKTPLPALPTLATLPGLQSSPSAHSPLCALNTKQIKCQQYAQKIFKIIKAQLQDSKHASTSRGIGNRKRVELQVNNGVLEAEVRELRDCVDVLSRRLERENQKKKESLKMLAEELEEKNQVIQDLRRSLHFYQSKYSPQNTILDSDMDTLRKQFQTSQRIRQKLLNDLDTTKQKLTHLSTLLSQKQQTISSLQSQLTSYKTQQYQLQLHKQKVQKTQQQLSKLIETLRSKLKQVSYGDGDGESLARSIKELKGLEAGVKVEVLMGYLRGSRFEDGIGYAQGVFSQDEVRVLERVREQWAKMKKTVQGSKSQAVKQSQLSGIHYGSATNKNEHSIFDMLQSPQSSTPPKHSITLKIMQIQLQKNRLSGQISQLKSKIMHIRDVVLNLLKCLQIQVGKKPEVSAILELIMEIFQYSEEERLGIFCKKKKLFGIF